MKPLCLYFVLMLPLLLFVDGGKNSLDDIAGELWDILEDGNDEQVAERLLETSTEDDDPDLQDAVEELHTARGLSGKNSLDELELWDILEDANEEQVAERLLETSKEDDDPDLQDAVEEFYTERVLTEAFQTITTKNEYKYIPVANLDLTKVKHIRFNVKACNDAHLNLLPAVDRTDKKSYEIVIGGWGNTQSVIRSHHQQKPAIARGTTKGFLNCKMFRPFWVSWDRGYIKVGRGHNVGDATTVFVSWKDPHPYEIRRVSVSTGWGSTGVWQVYSPKGLRGFWQFNEKDQGKDLSGNHNDAILHNVVPVHGPNGAKSAYEFAGTSSSYIRIPNNGALNCKSYTILMQVMAGTSVGPMFQWRWDNHFKSHWATHVWMFGNDLFFRIVSSTLVSLSATHIKNVFNPGQWSFVAVTYDFDTGHTKLWKDGKVISSRTFPRVTQRNSKDIMIGVSPVKGDNRCWNGKVSCYQFYEGALNQRDILEAQKMCSHDTIHRYAPRVYLHSGEEYWPSSVDYFLHNVHIKSSGGSVLSGQPNPLTSSNLPSGYDHYFLTTKQGLGCNSCTNPNFLNGQKLTSSSGPPTYAITVTVDSSTDTVDTFYWFFFPYNRGKRVCIGYFANNVCPCVKAWGHCLCPRLNGCIGGYSTFGHHVGDWEHITVRTVGGRPHSLYLSAHDFGGTYVWDGSKYVKGNDHVQVVNGHPVVYMGDGSHGVWSTVGRHVYKKLFNGDTLVDYTNRGVLWDTWTNLKHIPYKPGAAYSGDQSWLNYKGRWGNKKSGCGLVEKIAKECMLNSGPTGPQWKSSMSSSGLDKKNVDVAENHDIPVTGNEIKSAQKEPTASKVEQLLEELLEDGN